MTSDNREKILIAHHIVGLSKNTMLGGSLSLMIRDVIKERKASDIDIITNDHDEFLRCIQKRASRGPYKIKSRNDIIYDCGPNILRRSYEVASRDTQVSHRVCLFFNPYATIEKERIPGLKSKINVCTLADVVDAKRYIIARVNKHVDDVSQIGLYLAKDQQPETSIVELM